MKRTGSIAALCAPLCLALSCAVVGVAGPEDIAETVEPRTDPFPARADGEYAGSCRIAVPSGTPVAYPYAEVSVSYREGRVVRIEMDRPEALAGDDRFRELGDDVVEQNTLEGADCVSGATFSSLAFLKAVEQAVFK